LEEKPQTPTIKHIPEIPAEVQEQEDQHIEIHTLSKFLKWTKEQTLAKIEELQRTLEFVESDITRLDKLKKGVPEPPSAKNLGKRTLEHANIVEYSEMRKSAKRRMLEAHLPSLQESYNHAHAKLDGPKALQYFSNNFTKFTGYTDFQVIKTMSLSQTAQTPRETTTKNRVFSAGEFDYTDTMFSVACNNNISMYDYEEVVRGKTVEPKQQIVSDSIVGCMSYNSYFRSKISTGGSNGTVNIWCLRDGSNYANWKEHSRRVWSVDFSLAKPTLLSSSSEDNTVKIWCINQPKSVSTIKCKIGACIVRFNPFVPDQIAVGSADHSIYYYDLRYTHSPLITLDGHRKTVSNLRFLSKNEFVSSSVDNTLKLWDTSNAADNMCVRTYSGHVNHKNFVGLSCTGDYISCGSEDNSVVTYHKDFSNPAIAHKFNENVSNDAISTLSWKHGKNALLAGSCSGDIKFLRLH